MKRWRHGVPANASAITASEYDRPELKWTQSSFIQPQMMVEDRYFYDPVARQVHRGPLPRRPRKALRRHRQRAGLARPIPTSASTTATSSTCFRDLPGGMAGVRADGRRLPPPRRPGPLSRSCRGTRARATKACREARGARRGTAGRGRRRRHQRRHHAAPCREPSATRPTRPAIRLRSSPKSSAIDEALAWNNLNWGQATPAPAAVSGGRRSRQLVSQVQMARAAPHGQHLRPLGARQERSTCSTPSSTASAWRPGRTSGASGTRITPRDAEAVRRIAKIERKFAAAWSAPTGSRTRRCCKTASMREQVSGAATAPSGPSSTGMNSMSPARRFEVPYNPRPKYFDLWHGVELNPAIGNDRRP